MTARKSQVPRLLGNGDLIKRSHLVMTFWRSRVAVSSAMDTRLEQAPPPSGVLRPQQSPRWGRLFWTLAGGLCGGPDRPTPREPTNPGLSAGSRRRVFLCHRYALGTCALIARCAAVKFLCVGAGWGRRMRSQMGSLRLRIAALEDMTVDLIARLCELDRLREEVRKLELSLQRSRADRSGENMNLSGPGLRFSELGWRLFAFSRGGFWLSPAKSEIPFTRPIAAFVLRLIAETG
jgi:hypothetical protein